MQKNVIGVSEVRKSLDKLNTTTFENIKTTNNLERGLAVRQVDRLHKKNMYSTSFNLMCRCAAFIAEQYVGDLHRFEKKTVKNTIDHINKAVSLERTSRGFIENYPELMRELDKIEDPKVREEEIAKFKKSFEDADLWFELEDTINDIMMRFSGALLTGKLHQVKDALKYMPRADKL